MLQAPGEPGPDWSHRMELSKVQLTGDGKGQGTTPGGYDGEDLESPFSQLLTPPPLGPGPPPESTQGAELSDTHHLSPLHSIPSTLPCRQQQVHHLDCVFQTALSSVQN